MNKINKVTIDTTRRKFLTAIGTGIAALGLGCFPLNSKTVPAVATEVVMPQMAYEVTVMHPTAYWIADENGSYDGDWFDGKHWNDGSFDWEKGKGWVRKVKPGFVPAPGSNVVFTDKAKVSISKDIIVNEMRIETTPVDKYPKTENIVTLGAVPMTR